MSACHARMHKRGSSASSITGPSAVTTMPDAQAFLFNRSETPAVTYEEPWNDTSSYKPAPAAHSMKIKPYLRKLSSSRDTVSLDLSRSAADNEHLVGFGIPDYSRSVSDVNFNSINGPVRHARSTSNTSQFSAASSARPTYMPPARHTPREFTPPISKSSPSSLFEGDHDANNFTAEDDFRRHPYFDAARRSGSISSSNPPFSPPLRINTTGSLAGLGNSYSQSAASLTYSPVGQSRSRGETLQSLDTTASPASRTSFDKARRFMRGGGRDSPVDAASRAASIRAARQAFMEKEEAKERKYEKEEAKLAAREYQKRQKKEGEYLRKQYKEEKEARKSETNTRRSRSVSDSNEKSTPRPSIGVRQYSDHREAHSRSLPTFVATVDNEKHGAPYPKVTKTRAAKGRWLRFVTWFKTRILRMSNRVHK
ncbi:hypothetical protein M011DRAFT_491774 [Sporormia fimetaria CBS 119925]|uniref:Uncharacterized protein n=1 Tax=Sporormia fimetaria CBS 119925 TaxID=1340428 RepID=A0A6A6VN20_9PLEO|nr:hypothetical protein M011DRAFT_491774 [Sporormia fimetaria CBS 119925]